MLLPLAAAAFVGYLLGSIPVGYLVARARGVNIFEVGSKNPGATNVRRVLGRSAGNLVFGLDALKGALAAAWALLSYTSFRWSAATSDVAGASADSVAGAAWVQLGVVGLVAALLGHSFSCFTRFRGGKGVATSVGGLLILMPVVVLIAGAAWAATFYSTRYVSLASIVAALVLVAAAYLLQVSSLLVGLAAVVAVFVILRHRSNIVRLLNGTENKFARKHTAPSS